MDLMADMEAQYDAGHSNSDTVTEIRALLDKGSYGVEFIAVQQCTGAKPASEPVRTGGHSLD